MEETSQVYQPQQPPSGGGLFASLKNMQPQQPPSIETPTPAIGNVGNVDPTPAATATPTPTVGGGSPAPTAQPQQGQTGTTVGNVQNAAAGAKLVTNTAFLIFPRICAAYSGEDSSRYDLREKDKNDYERIWYEYLLVSNLKISPALTLIICTLTIFAGMFMNALKDKKKNSTLKGLRQRTDNAATPTPTPAPTPQERVMQQIEQHTAQKSFAMPRPENLPTPTVQQPVNIMTDKADGRKKFKIDSRGFYEYDKAGNRLIVENRVERPAADVFWMLSKGYTNRQILAEL